MMKTKLLIGIMLCIGIFAGITISIICSTPNISQVNGDDTTHKDVTIYNVNAIIHGKPYINHFREIVSGFGKVIYGSPLSTLIHTHNGNWALITERTSLGASAVIVILYIW